MGTTLILGAGVMGSAFSIPLADSGGRVLLAGTHLDDQWIDALRRGLRHPKLGMPVPANVEPLYHSDLDHEHATGLDLVVLGVSSPGIHWAIDRLAGILSDPVPVLLLTKGLAVAGGQIVPFPGLVASSLEKQRGWDPGSVTAGGVGGPCIAGELAARRQTGVVMGVPLSMRRLLGDLLRVGYYKVRFSNDIAGVEVCAALKNLLAIGVATAAGARDRTAPAENGAHAHNTEAELFVQAAEELAQLTVAMGGQPETAAGRAGVGDLYVTCQAGRNSRMGRLLGAGLRIGAARDELAGETVEGADLATTIGPTIRAMVRAGELDGDRLPLTKAILAAVCDGQAFRYEF